MVDIFNANFRKIWFFLQTSHYCILVHLSWILIKTRRQDLIITIPQKSMISTNSIIPPQIFHQFEYVSSNLHLVLSSLTTFTTSPTQFIRNPLRTITRVPTHHSSFYFRIICNILMFFVELPEFWLYACPLRINRFRAVCRYCN